MRSRSTLRSLIVIILINLFKAHTHQTRNINNIDHDEDVITPLGSGDAAKLVDPIEFNPIVDQSSNGATFFVEPVNEDNEESIHGQVFSKEPTIAEEMDTTTDVVDDVHESSVSAESLTESTATTGKELLQNYLNSTYMANISKNVADCVSNPQLYSVDFCRETEYLNEIGNYISKFSFISTTKSGKKRRMPQVPDVVIMTADDKYTYQYAFENYISKNKPFKGQMEIAGDQMNRDYLSECLSLTFCKEQLTFNPSTNDSSINQFSKFLHTNLTLFVPKIATNNYLYRIQLSDLESEHNSFISLASHWPSTFHLQKGDVTNVHQCPANMHMALWSTNFIANIEIRMFHQTSADHFGIDLEASSLHHPTFKNHGFMIDEALPKFAQAFLGPNEFLFVPSSAVVSLFYRASLVESPQQVPLFRSCFVDASNLNSFRKYLDLSGKVSKYDAAVAKLFQSSEFPTAMKRDAIDSDHFVLQQHASSANFMENLSSGNEMFENDNSALESPTIKTGKSRVNRRNRGSKGGVFKEWQETNKWNKMITSLTIPQPDLPGHIIIGRNNFTAEWVSPFVPAANDKTKFGFNFTVCSTSQDIAGIDKETIIEKCRAVTFVRSDGIQQGLTLRERKGRNKDDEAKYGPDMDERAMITYFSADITGLGPSSRFRFRVNIFFDTFLSLPSDWSTVMTTMPLTPPSPIPMFPEFDDRGSFIQPKVHSVFLTSLSCTSLKIVAYKPIDDGGSIILGFHVYMRVVDDGYPKIWQYDSLYPFQEMENGNVVIMVNNLIPGPSYEVALAAMNSVGNASLSEPSNAVPCTCGKGMDLTEEMIMGDGHKAIYDPIRKITMTEKHSFDAAFVLDSARQILSCNIPSEKRDLFVIKSWSGHFALKFKVMAQAVLVNKGGGSLSGRIGIVHRGELPLAVKAKNIQQDGGIGMIVIDSFDRCDEFDQSCMPGANKRLNEGWGLQDVPAMWKNIHLPIIIVPINATERIAECINFKIGKTVQHEEM